MTEPWPSEEPWEPSGPADMFVYADAWLDSGPTFWVNVGAFNVGGEIAQDIMLTGTISPVEGGWNLESSDGCQLTGNELACDWSAPVPDPNYQSFGLSLSGPMDCEGVQGEFTVTATNDADPSNNRATVNLTDFCDRLFDASIILETFEDADTYGFIATVTNHGPNAATNWSLEFILPSSQGTGTAWDLEHEGSQCEYFPDSGYSFVWCDVDTVAANETRTVKATAPKPVCSPEIQVWASTYAQWDLNWENNFAELAFDPPICDSEADTYIELNGTRMGDDRLRFTVTLTNPGPADALNASGFLYLYDDAFADRWTVAPTHGECDFREYGDLTCSFGTIPVGESRSFVVLENEPSCFSIDAFSAGHAANEADFEDNWANIVLPDCEGNFPDYNESPGDGASQIGFADDEQNDSITITQAPSGVDWADILVGTPPSDAPAVFASLNGGTRAELVENYTQVGSGPVSGGDFLAFCSEVETESVDVFILHMPSNSLLFVYTFDSMAKCGTENPVPTSPTASIPFFPSPWSLALGVVGALLGALILMRRRSE